MKIEQFSAKIKFENVASEKLFEKLGFAIASRSEVFEETTWELAVAPEVINRFANSVSWTRESFQNPEPCSL